jgi:hypothetical protein
MERLPNYDGWKLQTPEEERARIRGRRLVDDDDEIDWEALDTPEQDDCEDEEES